MDYNEAVEYLYTQMPLFQNVGGQAYKEGLENSHAIDRHLGYPHKWFPTVHIAGTNGKGSVSHTLAAIMQASGLKVGLYTSPHLLDFRERIRVNGSPISKEYIIRFIEDNKSFLEPLHPSFFEVATALAFSWFAHEKVNIAIIETGLGGRLDCTNIITPELCVITNIGYDHMKFLGNTLPEIAYEKAGIIKPGVPVVIGEDCQETRPVFLEKARQAGAPIVFAQDNCKILSLYRTSLDKVTYQTVGLNDLDSCLGGYCQEKNANTILHAVDILRNMGYEITDDNIRHAFRSVCSMTGLMGRWQRLGSHPDIFCDTGHNSHGIKYIAAQLKEASAAKGFGKLRIVMGMVSDKDITQVLEMMPGNAIYYFTQASVKRAMNVNDFRNIATHAGLDGKAYSSVPEAVRAAISEASDNDLIFIGGSTFIVADLLGMPEFAAS